MITLLADDLKVEHTEEYMVVHLEVSCHQSWINVLDGFLSEWIHLIKSRPNSEKRIGEIRASLTTRINDWCQGD